MTGYQQGPKPQSEHFFGYRFTKFFPKAVGTLSLLSLIKTLFEDSFTNINYPSILVSVLGLAATTIYFVSKRKNKPIEFALIMFSAWILCQSAAIETTQYLTNGNLIKNPIWSVYQFLKLSIGYSFKAADGDYMSIQFNFLVLFFIGWIGRFRLLENAHA